MFSFKSIAHFLASAVHDVKVGAQFLTAHQAQINQVVEVGATVASIAVPAAAPEIQILSRAGEAALGQILAVIAKTDEAAQANGLDVHLDAAAIVEFKALLPVLEKLKPGSTAIPAGLQ